MRRIAWLLVVALVSSCSGRQPAAPPPAPAPPRPPLVISVVGTSDLHGHIEALPVLGGYLANLRAARAARAGQGGAVLLVDAGDMFQGTLESNLLEGEPVVTAYDALGYAAAAIGNHEFDFGPVGAAAVAVNPDDDPRGALRARARQAEFPFLMANVVDAKSGALPAWDNVRPTTTVNVNGVEVGIVGVTTEETPRTTMPANFAGLKMLPLAATIRTRAHALRAAGAQVVIVVAHAGGACHELDDPSSLDSCDTKEEIFQVARALTPDDVDLIVAAHTHSGIANDVGGIPVIESFAYGRAFGRVDLTVDRQRGRVTAHHIFPPQDLCRDPRADHCEPYDYAGGPVHPDEKVAKLLEPAVAHAHELAAKPIGVTLAGEVRYSYKEESAEGNLFADLMLAAHPADVALTNGGGLRAALPAGQLTYGQLYRAMPFDNRFATVHLHGRDLAQMIAGNLHGSHGIFCLAGARATAHCDKGELVVELTRAGKRVPDDAELVVVTNDFLASGGDGVFGPLHLPDGAIVRESGPTIRDEMARVLGQRGGSLDPASLYDAKHPRLSYPGKRPVSCR